MSETGLVIIGRNEGERLRECFQSVATLGNIEIVYVDSGSNDDSVLRAKDFQISAFGLTTDKPFSAARARNEGASWLCSHHPAVKYLQFLDGDCILEGDWFKHASEFLALNPSCAAVIGQLQERYPERSVYNYLCALEWRSVAGQILDFGGFGGISMIRRDVFLSLEGFREDVIAGEDSELAVRMSLAGFSVFKLPFAMAKHDAGMTTFRQWWRRAKRSGHAIAQRADLNGASSVRDCIGARRSVFVWGVVAPFIAFSLCFLVGALALVFPFLSYGYLGYRIFMFRRKQGDGVGESLLYASFNIVAKFAQVLGVLQYYRNSLNKRFEIIEYK